jgi:hypothetical protein
MFRGANVVRSQASGIRVSSSKDTYQTVRYPNVSAGGIAAGVEAPWNTANAVGVDVAANR